MSYINTIKTILVFLLLNQFSQLFAQTQETGIVKGIVFDKNAISYNNIKKVEALPFGTIFIKLNSGDIISTVSDKNGNYEFEVPSGKHILNTNYLAYNEYTREIVVKPNDTLECFILLDPSFKLYNHQCCCPLDSSEPYSELQGKWECIYYENGSYKIEKGTSDYIITANFLIDGVPGNLNWYDGCYNYRGLCFRHKGKGIIEVAKNGTITYTFVDCINDRYGELFRDFIYKMADTEIKTIITENGQVLELVLGKEKLVFHKLQ